ARGRRARRSSPTRASPRRGANTSSARTPRRLTLSHHRPPRPGPPPPARPRRPPPRRPAGLRIAVLILQGEAAYQSGDHAAPGGAFRRVLLEFPDAPQTPLVRLAPAWTAPRAGWGPPGSGGAQPPPPRVSRLRPPLARQPPRSRPAPARRRAGDGGR